MSPTAPVQYALRRVGTKKILTAPVHLRVLAESQRRQQVHPSRFEVVEREIQYTEWRTS